MLFRSNTPFFWQSTLLPWIGFCLPKPDSAFEKNRVWLTNVACFEGALIHESVFQKIGYANPEYFIGWDDTDFGYRASQFFTVAYCKVPSLQRRRGFDNIQTKIRSIYKASDLYRYYHIRNRFIFIKTILNTEKNTFVKPLIFLCYHGFTFVLIAKELVRAALFREKNLGKVCTSHKFSAC